MKNQLLFSLPAIACLFLLCYCIRINESHSQYEKETQKTIHELRTQLQTEKGLKQDQEKEECVIFLKDYSHIIELIKKREQDTYLKLIESDKAILNEINKLRNIKPAKTESRRLMENRFIAMLKGEINYCTFVLNKKDTEEIPQHEYHYMMQTFPSALFYMEEPSDEN